MRRPRWAGGLLVVAGVAVGLAGGCLPRVEAPHSAGWLSRVRGWNPASAAPDGLFVETAIVDQPAPDPFLARDLWAEATAINPLPAERTALLELNGLRVRVTTGIPPAKLQALLNSDDDVLDPKARTLTPGQTKIIPVNGPVERMTFAVRRELKSDPVPADLTDVEWGFAVTARPDGGKVSVRCEPRVQFGDRQQFLKPTADGAGFARKEQKPSDTYPTIGWDVVLGPGDYLIVGPTADPSGTLGEACFLATGAANQVRQRVLVVRAGRLADAPTSAGMTTRPTAAAAAQAGSRPTARGTGE